MKPISVTIQQDVVHDSMASRSEEDVVESKQDIFPSSESDSSVWAGGTFSPIHGIGLKFAYVFYHRAIERGESATWGVESLPRDHHSFILSLSPLMPSISLTRQITPYATAYLNDSEIPFPIRTLFYMMIRLENIFLFWPLGESLAKKYNATIINDANTNLCGSRPKRRTCLIYFSADLRAPWGCAHTLVSEVLAKILF